MGYRKITNLYKDNTVLMFKRLYALEKIHGTSTNISFKSKADSEGNFKGYDINYFSGGAKHESFVELFNSDDLVDRAMKLGFNTDFIVYGEGYGGKMQGMSNTYGKDLKFVAFEVKIGDKFVDVPFAETVVKKLGLEFVHYEEIDADPETIDWIANAPSVQAKRNSVENPQLPREGVILRPLREFLHPDGKGRIMAKHKNDLYKEREHSPKIQDPEKLKKLENARQIAEEWVVPMRLNHVLDKLKAQNIELSEKSMNIIIKAMVEDVYTEAKGEIVESKTTRKAIGKRTAKLFIQYLKEKIN